MSTIPAELDIYRVGDRLRFAEERRPYTVQAVSASGRYLVCTKPFAARRTVLYTVVDLVDRVRGVDNSIGNSLGYETRADCERAAALFDDGDFGFSHRHRPIPLNVAGHVSSDDGEGVQGQLKP
jgi:hypothetical protein